MWKIFRPYMAISFTYSLPILVFLLGKGSAELITHHFRNTPTVCTMFWDGLLHAIIVAITN